MIITGPQCRAARALIELSAEQVAGEAGVSAQVVRDFESKIADPGEAVKRRLFAALEAAGAVFIPENGGGVGVRLKYSRRDVRGVNKWESEGGPVGEDDV
ncbi:MAG TPA: helix-turn-helix transcriptional regulator [Steroidobacteraceae bacterium]|nr:helix-turn-helix transcriptional regulator [Steroidobacteraceae bacterium]